MAAVPEELRFQHLLSEFSTIQPADTDKDSTSFVEGLVSRSGAQLFPSWNELYRFELILARYIPDDMLRGRIIRLRYVYRSIVGQNEFDSYLASKPPDLQSPPDSTDPTHAQFVQMLRQDLKDLLGLVYEEYAVLPVREYRLNVLTLTATGLVFVALVALLAVVGYLSVRDSANVSGTVPALTIFVVVVSGAMGGFVSALRRIQTPNTEGDSLYNLSILYNGAKSILTAPITGAIFAILLYMMFAAGLLSGNFFPTIFTPEGNYVESSLTDNASLPRLIQVDSANSITGNSSLKPGLAPSPVAKATPTPKKVPHEGIGVVEFLAKSGPGDGQNYALLIVWCFIAGFAERFVPDALDRIISARSGSSK